jgi:DNA polymerase III alpha subunit (gram-positive type)
MKGAKLLLEIIAKARVETKQKSGMLAYWLKSDNRFIINYANVSFLKKDKKETLNVILETQGREGFLFWANSPEGEKFYHENYNKIQEALNIQLIKPWSDHEYGIEKPKES